MTKRQPAAKRAFPEWARQALATFEPMPAFGETAPSSVAVARHATLAERVRAAWPALCARAIPEFERLGNDRVRQRVFESVLALLKYRGASAHYVEHRGAQREADKLAQAIATMAGEMAVLLQRRAALIESDALADEVPDLFDCLEAWHADAEQTAEYTAWAGIAAEPLRRFLTIARTQSRPGPRLAELLQVIAEGPRFEDRALQSRKATSDLRRALLRELEPVRLTALGAPPEFRFTDGAIAELLTSLFAEDTDADDVRKARAALG